MVISLRNLPEHIERKIVEKSAKENISLNKAVIALLEGDQVSKRKPKNDVSRYLRTISDEEWAELEPVFASMRVVDPIDWE